jgi:hypothetical protein
MATTKTKTNPGAKLADTTSGLRRVDVLLDEMLKHICEEAAAHERSAVGRAALLASLPAGGAGLWRARARALDRSPLHWSGRTPPR